MADSFTEFMLDQLTDFPGVTARFMFGGHGLYRDQIFFGIIHQGCLYLKTDEAGRSLYRERGMQPFRPNATQTLRHYYEVPIDIVEDREQLIAWAERASRCTSPQTPHTRPTPKRTRL